MKKLAIVFMTILFLSGVFPSTGQDSTAGSFIPGGGGGGGDKCYHSPKQC